MSIPQENRSVDIEFLKSELLPIKNKLDLLTSLYDDLATMYFKLEEDLYQSGKIKKMYSDDGQKYSIIWNGKSTQSK